MKPDYSIDPYIPYNPTPDWSKVLETVLSSTQSTLENHYENDDDPHYIWEAVMTAVYGPEYWQWRRNWQM